MNVRMALIAAFAWMACAMAVPAIASSPDAAIDGAVAAARASVEQRLGHAFEHVELDITSKPERMPSSKGALEFRVLPVAGRWPRSRFTTMVEVLSGGHVLRTVPVGFALSATATALVYRSDTADHVMADQLDLVTQDVDVAGGRDLPLRSADALKGKRLRRAVRAGQAVSADDFEDVPDVDNRQTVRLLVNYGGITVERPGVAMRAANKGEVVPVQVAGTNEPVKATVMDRGVTQVVP
jgi:flagella basal body P-ring formation protein FlgA